MPNKYLSVLKSNLEGMPTSKDLKLKAF